MPSPKEVNKVQFVIHEFGAEICDILPSAQECQKWLKNFHDGLVYRKKGRSAFADKLIAEAKEFIAARSACGKLGGRPRKTPTPPAFTSRPSGMPEFYDFVAEANLSEADSREWLDRTKENGWKDGKGRPIADWRKACEAYCARRAINRMAKGET